VPVWTALALAYHLASRLADVLYGGLALRRQERTGYFTRRYGPEEGFRRFRRAAAILMSSDAVSFVVLCVVSRNTLAIGSPRGFVIAAGAVLVLVGVLTKAWAAATLGGRAYYWSNFFGPANRTTRPNPPPCRRESYPLSGRFAGRERLHHPIPVHGRVVEALRADALVLPVSADVVRILEHGRHAVRRDAGVAEEQAVRRTRFHHRHDGHAGPLDGHQPLDGS